MSGKPGIRNGNWSRTLNAAQRKTVIALYKGHSDGRWSVCMMPTTRTPTHLELRHHLENGLTARWVIEQDGDVSAWNVSGALRELVPYERAEAA